MAQTYPVRGIGTKGVSEDVPASELGLEYFNYAENVHVHDMRLKNTPKLEEVLAGSHGDVQWFSYLYDENTREPIVVYVGRNNQPEEGEYGQDTIYTISPGDLGNVDGSQKGVSVSRLAGYTDISGEAYSRWNGFVQNGTVVLTNGADVPQFLALGATAFDDMPAWDANWTCKVIQPFRGVWVALNIFDATAPTAQERQPSVVRWSSPIADYGSPPAYWSVLDEFDQPTGAGYNPLGETPGEIVTGKTLRDCFLIYKTDSVVRMDYTGSPEVPFSFRTLFDDTGAWGPNSVCALRNEHFVVGTNDVYITDGFQKRSVITSKVKDTFDKLVFSTSKAHDVIVVPHYGNEEVFVLIRTKNANGTLSTRLLCYNYEQDQWFYRNFSGATNITYAGLGALSLADPVAFDRWDDQDDMSWDEGTEVASDQWDNFTEVVSVSYLMFATNEKFMSYGAYRNAVTGENCIVHKHDMDFNDVAGLLSDRIKRVLRIYPIVDPESRGYLVFKLWGHDRPGQIIDESYKKYYLFDCLTDHKIDVTVSGRYVSMEISTDDALKDNWDTYDFQNNPVKPTSNPDNAMSLTGVDLDLVAKQRR